ncbi:lactate utilization protein B [Hoylesella marshii]|uniref:Iron-sulfur cluster-binding protein n=1 Tax=Hoylesella marshii DSM 16973 = JCM 13450 TaxID=862515 RepID=E0NUS2_9BACT|nr:lactate utilization protein B [Hoylesella marshii]EFM01179.1 putative iron-sulfur cluster-binding protein [Hoylesella marshii DSM 16973 = JCM 13450]
MSTVHSRKAHEFLQDSEKITRHDKTFYGVREKRDVQAFALPEWEDLREHASQIKRHTATHLADYLEKFSKNLESRGVIVHWAENDNEFNEIVLGILKEHNAKKLVKSKSMLTEECEMNPYLEKNGIDVVETDLGERIIQLMGQKPSHIVMPALHITRHAIGEEFERRGISKEIGNHDPTYLTRCARYHLRDNFMDADAGLTGCNFGVAETGDVVVCTNEGNADMSTSMPKLHIVAMGIEKLVPDYRSLAVFQRLLCRCGTGQPTTTYTSHFRQARPGAEMHVVLVDNGRSNIIANDEHFETIKCIRCGACMNTCPVYRRSTGYSYTYFIPGPIGVNLGMLKDPRKYADNVSACSLCLSCSNVCPAKIDLGEQIYRWRQQLDSFGRANPVKKLMSQGMSFVFNHPMVYNTALSMAPMANVMPRFLMYNDSLNAWGMGHEMMVFPKESFQTLWKKGKVR